MVKATMVLHLLKLEEIIMKKITDILVFTLLVMIVILSTPFIILIYLIEVITNTILSLFRRKQNAN